jgi:hypothetical protein
LRFANPPHQVRGRACGDVPLFVELDAPSAIDPPLTPALQCPSARERGSRVALSKHPPRGHDIPSTVRLHRVLATKPDKLYRAFIEPDALAKWLPPNGLVYTVYQSAWGGLAP